MPTELKPVRTGWNVLGCHNCGSQCRFSHDDQWSYDPISDGYFQVISTMVTPEFCPVCGSKEIELSDELIDPWLYYVTSAGWRVAPETIDLAQNQLYQAWINEGRHESFVQFLIDFKAAVQRTE